MRVKVTRTSGLSFAKYGKELGDKVRLVAETDNLYDPYAIRIEDLNGEKIGYIAKTGNELYRLTGDESEALFNSLKEPQEVDVVRANYYDGGEELWEGIEKGQVTQLLVKVTLPSSDNTTQLRCAISKTLVNFDEANHIYTNAEGKIYLSGSTFAGNYTPEFDGTRIAKAMVKRLSDDTIKAEDIVKCWKDNNEASYGTLMHKDMENYIKWYDLSTKLGKEYHLPKNLYRRKIVEDFFFNELDLESQQAQSEAFIADEDKLMCGTLDILEWVDKPKKIVRVGDFKFNKDILGKEKILAPFTNDIPHVKLGAYWLQLSFYAYILQRKGYTVEGLDIYWHDGSIWHKYSSDVLDLKGEV